MNLQFRLAFRLLKGKNKYFFSFSNIIAFLGIIIGLLALIIVSSVMDGLSQDMSNRISSTKGELRVIKADFSPFDTTDTVINSLNEKYPDIVGSGPVNRDDLLIQHRSYTAYSQNFGIDYDRHKEITNIFDTIKIGYLTADSFREKGIIIGLDMAFNILASVGDTVEVISPAVMSPTPFGLIPKTEKFRILGVFSTGLPEFDGIYSYIDIEKSKSFKRHNGVDYIELKTSLAPSKLSFLTQAIEKDFPGVKAESWKTFDKTLYQAIKVEKYAMFVVMTIIIILASFNITGNFIRTVTQKKSEIATLKTLGICRKGVFWVFIAMGLTVCSAGVVIADFIAFLLLSLQQKYELIQIPIPGFPFTAVPVDVNLTKIVLFSFLTLTICLVGTIYPAYKTMKVDIIKVLHDEND